VFAHEPFPELGQELGGRRRLPSTGGRLWLHPTCTLPQS
jgi:hypothetical protein